VTARTFHQELVDACQGRDLSPAATAEYCRLIFDGTDQDIAAVLDHLRVLPRTRTGDTQPCRETADRFDDLWEEARVRQGRHGSRIVATARRLASEVASYRTTLPDAEAQLERLCNERDAAVLDLGEVRIIPWAEGTELAAETFRAALAEAEQGRSIRWAS
jgi:hypothetical protein